MPPLELLSYAGLVVFAASGAIAAAERKHTIVEFMFFATVTAVGGGTVRDLLIDAPVFWVAGNGPLGTCVVTALLVWLLGERVWNARILVWLDACGLVAFAVLGAAKTLALGFPALVAVAMGVLTGTFGGIVRDVLANRPSILLGREIYVTATIVSAGLFVLLSRMGLASMPAGIIGVSAGFALRGGALVFGWTLPGYRDLNANESSPG
ncbi:trimeric intracellular cation channel family protein [Sphingobium subterraneum]|uniref:Putative membrane protein YeiH n=1 Tax=Sphingobium subterraneum TaxID=627688 RepID=A0A841J2S4_9SPHN|nr:trimeric intracellular cation channel family protein [Sphingobium subterraneum]MBB6125117.1 putative membrane protein YeiH [Sphingobium subterraneum]